MVLPLFFQTFLLRQHLRVPNAPADTQLIIRAHSTKNPFIVYHPRDDRFHFSGATPRAIQNFDFITKKRPPAVSPRRAPRINRRPTNLQNALTACRQTPNSSFPAVAGTPRVRDVCFCPFLSASIYYSFMARAPPPCSGKVSTGT